MDEVFEFEFDAAHGNIVKFKKITDVSSSEIKITWQMYNPEFRKWVRIEYDIAFSYFNLLIQERKVLIEKKGNIQRRRFNYGSEE